MNFYKAIYIRFGSNNRRFIRDRNRRVVATVITARYKACQQEKSNPKKGTTGNTHQPKKHMPNIEKSVQGSRRQLALGDALIHRYSRIFREEFLGEAVPREGSVWIAFEEEVSLIKSG